MRSEQIDKPEMIVEEPATVQEPVVQQKSVNPAKEDLLPIEVYLMENFGAKRSD